MEKNTATTEVDATGLRYKSKANVSPFGMKGVAGETLSCYKFGEHKARSRGSFRVLIGKRMFMCGECKPKADKN